MSDTHTGNSTIVGPSVVPRLEIIQGEPLGKSFRLKFKTRLGREADNDIVISDPRVSRYHCQITYENGAWLVADLGSANGTTLNAVALRATQRIQHGDQVGLGETILLFRDPVAEETSPPIDPTPVAAKPATTGSESGSTSRLARIAGGLVLVFLLALAAIFLWLSRPGPNPVANPDAPTAPAMVDAPTEIATTVADTPPENMTLLYEDDFSASDSGWDDASGPFYTKRYGNNQYNIDISTNNLVVWGLANRLAADFEIEVDAVQRQGGQSNTYGILFRFVDNDNYYRFDVSGDGFFHLAKLEDGQWNILVDWTGTSAIQQGQDVNKLNVRADGTELSIGVNGQNLATVEDSSFGEGNFGFFASTFDDPNIWVSFDDLRLYGPSGEELVIVPTATPVRLVRGDIAQVGAATTPTPAANTPSPEPATEPAGAVTPTPEPVDVSTPDALTSTAVLTEAVAEAAAEIEADGVEEEVLPNFVSRDQFLGRGERALAGKLVFPIFDAGRGTYDVFQANLDGSERTLIAAEASQPSMNDAGTIITYRSWKADERGLVTRPLDETVGWRYVQFFEAASPIFSPDEQFFVFHSRQGGETPALYRTFGEEHEVLRREGIPIQGSMPNFTPDGRLLYRGCLNNSCGLAITNLDGGDPQQLTDHANDTTPRVSPDGNRIAFTSDRNGNWDVYLMGIDGQNVQALTEAGGNDGLPVWSPDGQTLAFVSDRDGEWAVWAMAADGSQQRKLFALNGSIEGRVQIDTASSFGWLEESLAWTP